MGNNTSSTTNRRVQPSLLHTFNYNRLLSSSHSDSQEPLLVNYHDQNVEQLKLEIETNQTRNKYLEKRNAKLEEDMRDFKAVIALEKKLDSGMRNKLVSLEKQVAELKSTISMLKSVSSKPVTPDVEQLKRETETYSQKNYSEKRDTNMEKDFIVFETAVESEKKPNSDMENKVAALEKQVVDLKSDISRLKYTSSQMVTPGPSGSGSETIHLKKKVETLELQLMKLELDNSKRKKLDKETVAQKITELENQLLEPTPTHKTKPTSSVEPDSLGTLTGGKFGNPDHGSTNDLVRCLAVLIFLVAVLVGLNM